MSEKRIQSNKSIDEVLEKHGIQESKNSVVLLTSVYTASPEWFAEHDEGEVGAYFQACLEHARSRGEVINAVIHYDETTPHLHVAAVPVADVPDKKAVPVPLEDENGNIVYETFDDGTPRLDMEGNRVPVQAVYESGKSKGKPKYKRAPVLDENGDPVTHKGLNANYIIGNKVKMSREQTRFWEEVGKPFGMVRGEIRVEDKAEAVTRKTEAEYKADRIVEDAQQLANVARLAMEDAQQAANEAMAKRVEEEDKAAQSLRDAVDGVNDCCEAIDDILSPVPSNSLLIAELMALNEKKLNRQKHNDVPSVLNRLRDAVASLKNYVQELADTARKLLDDTAELMAARKKVAEQEEPAPATDDEQVVEAYDAMDEQRRTRARSAVNARNAARKRQKEQEEELRQKRAELERELGDWNSAKTDWRDFSLG